MAIPCALGWGVGLREGGWALSAIETEDSVKENITLYRTWQMREWPMTSHHRKHGGHTVLRSLAYGNGKKLGPLLILRNRRGPRFFPNPYASTHRTNGLRLTRTDMLTC